ncbi:MAG: hypothetical protein OXU20_09150 [Myxococcales bacterium]|nr:hypothetical protein [Myxococcales bacterium]
MRVEEAYGPAQFRVFRVVFGTYLCIHFWMLSADAPEVFSNAGMLPDGSLNPTARVFPNLLLWFDSPAQVVAFCLSLAGLSLGIALGIHRRVLAPVVWYGLACLFNRNVLISNPSLAFVGWLLLATALIPEGEGWALRPTGRPSPEGFTLPPRLYWGAWYLTAVGYTASGLHKLSAPSWRDGSALSHVLSIPLARDVPWRSWFLALDPTVLHILTWGALAAECIYLPLAIHRSTRPIAWISMVCMHIGILCFVDFADLTCAMLIVHLFLFDPRWLALPAVRRLRGLPRGS